jgi:hypothetical protein
MNNPSQPPLSREAEAFLSAAYKRMLRVTVVLSVAGAVLALFVGGWASCAGLSAGATVAYLNFVWLHHGANLTVQRMLAPRANQPSQQRVVFAFIGRYLFVLFAAYVILRSYPHARIAFIAGLALPVVAAMFEGVYEAVATGNNQAKS